MSSLQLRQLPRSVSRPQALQRCRARAQDTLKRRGMASKANPTPDAPETLPWQEYLAIRKRKRRWEMAVTIPSTIAGFMGGIAYFGTIEADPTKPIFNIDPMFVYGGATLGCAGLGYLIGPVIGSNIWRTTHRRLMKLIEKRDKQFHEHIVRNRVDPTRQSATNPVPDYYGPEDGSLHDYRQWLRDQAKFRRKASGFLSEE
ncbi:mitochondrial import protein Pam17 [Epithele typhae]|uniref:mitochondrial import protein Pam17 n=1 Tax=Epithele typhae TaxID=378194 RepID=UPI002007A832|nr:mitochondrial import protein Pam17 [Epithele typhae]KAH9921554.1 mitochondrial import protein Pam17 [Epithele typhae]